MSNNGSHDVLAQLFGPATDVDPERIERAREQAIQTWKLQLDARNRPVSVEHLSALLAFSGRPVSDPVVEAAAIHLTQARGRQLAEQWELDQVRGQRVKRTAREFATLPAAPAVIDKVLAAEVNLLAGPPGAGKSLLARDWALHVAAGVAWRGYTVTEPRNVLYVASEGLHDFSERWCTQPLWPHAADRIWVDDKGVNLLSAVDVARFIEEFSAERPGLVVFDVIYGMGMADDNGVKDVIPLLNAMKKISAEWGAATLALGHPGHAGDRRFRGSSQWRDLAYQDWHMADGQLTCEKSKLYRKEDLGVNYECAYPQLVWGQPTSSMAGMSEAYNRKVEELASKILAWVAENQGCSKNQVAAGVGGNRNRVFAVVNDLLEGGIGGLVEEGGKLWRRYQGDQGVC